MDVAEECLRLFHGQGLRKEITLCPSLLLVWTVANITYKGRLCATLVSRCRYRHAPASGSAAMLTCLTFCLSLSPTQNLHHHHHPLPPPPPCCSLGPVDSALWGNDFLHPHHKVAVRFTRALLLKEADLPLAARPR